MRRQAGSVLAIVAVALGVLTGCEAMDDSDLNPPALADSRWRVEAIDGLPVASAGEPTLEFQGADRVSGSTGCNRYFGQVTLIGNTIAFGQLGSTRRACAPALMEQESTFTQALTAAARYEAEPSQLLIYDSSGRQRLRLARVAG